MKAAFDDIFLGFDLGTSGLKLLAVDGRGNILNMVTKEYQPDYPQEGWSEQDPEVWWSAICEGFEELLSKVDRSRVRGIGCGGQMHGFVALDEHFQSIRPTILWNDGRTYQEVEYLNEVIGEDVMAEQTANIAFAGFTSPKILWMRKHEPENFARLRHVCVPKDFINLRLTGQFVTDVSDAAGTILMDVEHRCWSRKMLEICGLTEDMMPSLHESYEVIGTLLPEIAARFGLPEDVIVCAGAGDNAAAAIGTATVRNGDCNISLGTSGTIFISTDHFMATPNHALHDFAHANGTYHLMGAILCAASCNKWFCDEILSTKDYAGMQEGMEEKLGKNSVMFLPYLMGERSPINDTHARGTFIGLSLSTTRKDMLQAVLEGVAFAIRESYDIAKEIGIPIPRTKMCGGGAKSRLWCKIMANVLGIPVDLPTTEQGPGYGGAMLAMVGSGLYPDIPSVCDALVSIRDTIEPTPELVEAYNKKYACYKKLYPALKQNFLEMDENV